MKEQDIINHIEQSLNAYNRYYVNVHGSQYSQNGTPDIITSDKSGNFLAIEAKAPKQSPKINQLRHAIKILQSNNNARIIVAHYDFDIDDVDNQNLPIFYIGNVIGESEFDAHNIKILQTTEIKFKK